jgi:hypothetical protein
MTASIENVRENAMPHALYVVHTPSGLVLGAHAQSAPFAVLYAVRELPAHVFHYLVEAAELRSAEAVECEGYTLARFVRATTPPPAPRVALVEGVPEVGFGNPPRVVVTEAMAKITAALAVVGDLCEGKRQWIMSIPARPDHDPDLVIADALRSAERILAALADADAGGVTDAQRLDWLEEQSRVHGDEVTISTLRKDDGYDRDEVVVSVYTHEAHGSDIRSAVDALRAVVDAALHRTHDADAGGDDA